MVYSIIARDLITGKEALVEEFDIGLEYLLFQRMAQVHLTRSYRVEELIARRPNGTRVFEDE